MKIEISREEIEEILLDHIANEFSGDFNKIEWIDWLEPNGCTFVIVKEDAK